jgi:hypothetical protein
MRANSGESINKQQQEEEEDYEELVSVPSTRVGVIGVNFKTSL